MKKVFTICVIFAVLLSGCGKAIDVDSDSSLKEEQQAVAKESKEFAFSIKIPAENLISKLPDIKSKTAEIHRGQHFAILAQPLDKVSVFVLSLEEYYKKRYSDTQILNAYKAVSREPNLQAKTVFLVGLAHVGGYSDSSSITVNDKLYEYFFLENEKGEYVKANYQEYVDEYLLFDALDYFNNDISLYIAFPQKDVEKLMENSQQLFITFDGLKILPENRIEIKYPFMKYYSEAFPELETMIEEMENY